MFSRKKQPPIKSLIAHGTRIEGNVLFEEGIRIDGDVVGDIRASTEQPSILVISETARVEGNASKLSKGPSGSLLFVQCRLDQLSFGHRGQAIANAAARVPERYP